MTSDKNPRKELVDTIINSMKNRDGVWQKTWTNISGNNAPYNPVTGTKYSGVNFLVLSLKQTLLDTSDSRWCTFKQAVEAGYKITPGSKASQASFYDLNVNLKDGIKDHFIKAKSVEGYISKIVGYYNTKYPAKSAEIKKVAIKTPQYTTMSDRAILALLVTELNKITGADIKILSAALMKSFPIFNYSQLQNVPELEIKPINKFEPIQRAEGILIASGAKIFHDNANENYYSPKKHEIHLTPKESFKSPEAYYSTALHEIGHWTKGDGLPRNLKIEGEVNTEQLAYAREELRAELASVFMSSDLNLKLDIQNHSAYLGSYLEILSNDYTEFYAAVSDAQKIASHVISFENRLDLESAEAKELQVKNPELFNKIADYNLRQIELSATTQLNNNLTNDFEVGAVYITKWQGETRQFEITQINDGKLTVLDKVYEIAVEHTVKSFQEMISDYGCEKLDTLNPQILNKWNLTKLHDSSMVKTAYPNNVANEPTVTQIQIEARKPAHEVLKGFDTQKLAQKQNTYKAYLTTFFEEKNLPFKEFTITHNGETHFISNETVIDCLSNMVTPLVQERIKNILVKLDYENADLNHFLEHCAYAIIEQRAVDMEKFRTCINAEQDYDNSTTAKSVNTDITNTINDDNDFSI